MGYATFELNNNEVSKSITIEGVTVCGTNRQVR